MNDKAFLRRRRRRVQRVMTEHVSNDLNIVYTPPPNLGKTTGWLNVVQELERDATILQPDRNLRAETAEEAEAMGLNVLNIPAFQKSPIYKNNEQVQDWRDRGLPPRIIEKMVSVPDDDPYFSVMNKDWDEFDIVIGDFVHANLDNVVMDRAVALDDVSLYSGLAHEKSIGEIEDQVNEYLEYHDAPVTNIYDLAEAEDDVRKKVNDIANNHDSTEDIPTTRTVTAQTNNYVRILSLSRHEEDTRWVEQDKCITDDIQKIGYRTDDTLTIITIPMHLRAADSVNILSATPNIPVIEQFYSELGLASDIISTMNKQVLKQYFEKYTIVQLTQSRRPMSSGRGADPDRLSTIVDDFEDRLGKTPDVVTTKKAREQRYNDLDIDFHHYGEMIGINEHGHKDAAVISGAPNYGDDYVKRVAKFCGSSATVKTRENYQDVEWEEDIAQQIFDHMTKDTVLQAIMRFGRKVHTDVNIWVDTCHLPNWVPAHKPNVKDLVTTEPDSHLDVLDALEEESTVTDIYETLDYSKRQIYRALDSLQERGYVEVADVAKYGAEVFQRLKAELEETTVDVDEALTLSDNIITIRKCQQMMKTTVKMAYEDRTLTKTMGLKQSLPDISSRDEMQLGLGQF